MAKKSSRKATKKIILGILNKSSKGRAILPNSLRSFQENIGNNFMAVCKTEQRKLTEWTTKIIADREADEHQLNTFHEVTVRER